MNKWAQFLAIPAIILYGVLLFTYENWQMIDEQIATWLYGNDFVEGFHYFGETSVVIAIAVVLAIGLVLYKKYTQAIFVLVMIGGNFALNQLMKAMVARPRPDMENQLSSYSFPSGHTMASFTLLCVIAYLIHKSLKVKSVVAVVWIIMFILIILSGLSRVAGGRHFITDVLAGWSLAYAWFVLGVYVFEKRLYKR